MPKFVPVADPEAPRWEQDEAKLAKHRNFDSHVVARDQTEQRKLAAGRRAATNADEGRAILEPHLSDELQMAPTMLEAARWAVELAGTATSSSREGSDR